MSWFISDEKGVIEPYNDLPAMALALVGFIIFTALLAQSYSAYQQKAFMAEHYQDAENLAEKLSRDSALTGSVRPDIVDANKIEELNKNPDELMQKYGAYYDFMFKIEVNSAARTYSRVVRNPNASESKIGASASIPVTVKLNDVQELPGTLTVKIWRR